MTIICIETSTHVCSAALWQDGVAIKQFINYEGDNHAKLLPQYVEQLVSLARQQNMQIDAVAIGDGPGSYTGLRIGTGTAKGLCYGWGIPLIPIPTLQILCAAALAKMPNINEPLCPMIDARRMEIYTALYDTHLQSLTETQACVVDENFAPTKSYYYFGTGASKCQAVLNPLNCHFLDGIVPEAQYMGALAEQRIAQGFSGANVAYYEPCYLKEFIAAPSHIKGLT